MAPHLIPALRPLVDRVRTDVTAIKADGRMVWTREPLTDARLAKHLNGGPARGCCPIKPGESSVMLALFDLDSHKGEVEWDDMLTVCQSLIDALEVQGAHPVPFRSTGGHGIHVYMIWDDPQDAYSVRQFMAKTVQSMGYASGTAGVDAHEIEIFPKQDSVPVDGFGNQFILPLAGASEPLEPLLGLASMGRDYALEVVWRGSSPVPVLERPVLSGQTACEVDLGVLQEALDHIDPDLDHDVWARVLMGLHHATLGSAEGLAMADVWSAKGTKYQGRREVETKWASFGRRQDGALVTAYSILDLARQAGWVEDVSGDFEVLPTLPGTLPEPVFTRDRSGRIEASIQNVSTALRRPDLCGLQIGYDQFRDEIMWATAGGDQWTPFTDADYSRLRISLEVGGFRPVGRELVRDVVLLVADDNPFDSATTWLEGLAWDGVPRCAGFLHTYFGAGGSPYAKAVSKYLWTAMAGRVLAPGCKADMVPILIGEQGIRKSTGVAAMAPSPEFFAEISFHEKEDDLARRMRGRLLGEIGELRGLHTKELESIKAFITRTHESWVPKYREFATTYPRRIVFVGTTNQDEMLADTTGNRRWLPIRVTCVDTDGIAKNRLQLWAEARETFKTSGVLWQDAERLGTTVHADHMIGDAWADVITTWLHSPDVLTGQIPRTRGFLRIADVLKGALSLEDKYIGRREELRVAGILKGLGYAREKMRIAGVPLWCFVPHVPHRSPSETDKGNDLDIPF